MKQDVYLYRCDDCGHVTVLTRAGGSIDECCSLGELRRLSRAAVPDAKFESVGPNLKRNTVEGPPALLWLQGRDAFGLYVRGECVREIAGALVTVAVLKDFNALLASSAAPEA